MGIEMLQEVRKDLSDHIDGLIADGLKAFSPEQFQVAKEEFIIPLVATLLKLDRAIKFMKG